MSKKKSSNYNPAKWVVRSVDVPFTLYKIPDVFSSRLYVTKLKKEIEKLDFSQNVNDMFSLQQTEDFSHLKNNSKFPMLSEFLNFLDDFKNILSRDMRVEFEPTISVSSSKYCKNDFLLCHDDRVEDRYLAFIYYLNPVWEMDWGGSLDIFEHDDRSQPSQIAYRICPEFNTLIYFKVGNNTFHQVAEVVSDKTPRITINGWFHAKEALSIKSLSFHEEGSAAYAETHDTGALMYLQHFISNDFLSLKSESLICDTFREKNVIMLQEFLKLKIFDRISKELCFPCVKWNQKGPASCRKYYVVEESTLPSFTSAFLNVIRSKSMCSYLETICDQSLLHNGTQNGKQHGLVDAEIQLWKNTCYSLLNDFDIQLSNDTVEMWLFFNVKKNTEIAKDDDEVQPGNIYYCSECSYTPDCEIEPVDNSVCWVRKRKNQSLFVSYVSARSELQYHALRVRYKI